MPLTRPTQMSVPFANSGLKNTIPETATGSNRASMQEGFPAITMQDVDQGGMAPYGQDMNGILYDVTEAIRYQQAGGLFPYDATFAAAIDGYPLGAILTSADGRKLFQNTMNGNQSNPENGGANWTEITDIQITATGSTYPRKLSDRFADVVNVLDYGAKGDGTTDDTLAIQSAIDSNYNRTIFFPDGVYLVSDTIVTDCEVAKRQSILLSSGARIKASLTFSGDYVVNLGGRGTAPAYNLSDVPVGIYGGMIDCNSVASGLESVKTHCARIQNLNVWNAKDIGVYVGNSNNSSADAYIQNVSIGGISQVGSIGLWVDAEDCDVRDVRVRGCQTGIKMLKGGYIQNGHPIFGDVSQSVWEASIGFDVNGIRMVQCYADNFGTAFKVYNNRWSGSQLVAWWYENTSYTRTVFSIQEYWRGSVNGLTIHFPSSGVNRGIECRTSLTVSTFPYSWSDSAYEVIEAGLGEDYWSLFTDRYSDPFFLLPIHGKECVYSGNTGTVWGTGKWYPLVISQGYETRIDVRCSVGTKLAFDIRYLVNSNGLTVDQTNILQNEDNVSVDLKATYRTSIAGVPAYVLWFKPSADITGIISVSTKQPALQTQVFSHARAVQNFSPRTGNVYDISFSGVVSPEGTALSGSHTISSVLPAIEYVVDKSISATKSAIKYSSGRMTAWGKASYSNSNVPVTFPYEFIDTPSVSISANVLTNTRYTGLSTTGMNLQAGEAASISWVAEGMWK